MLLNVDILQDKRALHDNKYRRLKLFTGGSVCNLSINNQDQVDFKDKDETSMTISLGIDEIKHLKESLEYIYNDMIKRKKL